MCYFASLYYTIFMNSGDSLWIAGIIAIIAIVAFGGAKNFRLLPLTASSTPMTLSQGTGTSSIAQQITSDQNKLTQLQQELQQERINETHSPYYGTVTIQWVAESQNASSEYVSVYENSSATTSVDITGWTVKSLSSGNGTSIPDGVYLLFPDQLNGTQPIFLNPGDTAYLITGVSPNGYSFKVNKCSGYMSQYQTYTPYLSSYNCPSPSSENLSSIPVNVGNNTCFDYINSLPACQVPTNVPLTLSGECKNFITNTLGYNNCVNIHKPDTDFYGHTWYVYLARSAPLWGYEREDIVLLDTNGKVVSELKY